MSDQNRFDEYKQKLLHWWSVFAAACGRFWDAVKAKTGRVLLFLSRNGKILLQKLAAWMLKAREGLKKFWNTVRRACRKLLQQLAAWLLKIREKIQPMIQQAGEWLAALTLRFRRSKSDKTEELPITEEAPVLPAPAATEDAAPIEEAVRTEAEEPEVAADEAPVQSENADADPSAQKSGTVLGEIGDTLKLIVKWLWRLRTVFMAIPVVMTAVKLAMDNMKRLPESVGLDIQSTGEFARMITRQEAVFWPLGITAFCLVLMFCSKKPLLPWVISIFTLVLPWLIWLLNYYA